MEMHCGTCRHFGNIDYSKKQCVACMNSGTRSHWEAPLPAGVASVTPSDVDAVLNERGKRYGAFKDHAAISQLLQGAMRSRQGWERLSDAQKESLEMIAHKIARILNGDPNYADSWVDIAGYAKLIADELEGVSR